MDDAGKGMQGPDFLAHYCISILLDGCRDNDGSLFKTINLDLKYCSVDRTAVVQSRLP